MHPTGYAKLECDCECRVELAHGEDNCSQPVHTSIPRWHLWSMEFLLQGPAQILNPQIWATLTFWTHPELSSSWVLRAFSGMPVASATWSLNAHFGGGGNHYFWFLEKTESDIFMPLTWHFEAQEALLGSENHRSWIHVYHKPTCSWNSCKPIYMPCSIQKLKTQQSRSSLNTVEMFLEIATFSETTYKKTSFTTGLIEEAILTWS